MYRTDDPISDFHRYDAEQQEQLDRLPKCIYCHEPIQDDYLFNVDGELYCEDCMEDLFKRPVENYMR